MSKYLITGGAGFIGSSIAKELVKQGEKVVVLDNLHSGNLKNLEDIKKQIKFIKGDIRDLKIVKKAVKGVDYVLHQAALRGVFQSVKDPLQVNEVNITGTLNVLIAARDSKVKRVVLASSSSVYGKVLSGKNVETLQPYPQSPYALSKLVNEEYARIFYELYGLETISLRYFNVFGPYQNPKDPYAAVIPLFVNNLLKNKSSEIHGDGKQSRDFTFVDNVVRANLLAAKSKTAKIGETYNIANGENISIIDLYNTLQEILKIKIEPNFVKRRLGDMDRSFANIEKAKKYLDYSPVVPFAKGLKKALEWYKSNL